MFFKSTRGMFHRTLLCLLAIFSLTANAVFAGIQVPGPLVDTAWLGNNLANPDVVVIDIRPDISSFERPPTDKEKADSKAPIFGHIPGARFLEWKTVRESREIDGVKLDKMVPIPATYESMMRKLGVNNDQAIIIVTSSKDSDALTMGTRFYWTLKYYGHGNMAILDGGLKKWQAEGRQLVFDKPAIEPSQFSISKTRPEMLALLSDVERVVKGQATAQLVDGRTADYYVGQNMTSDVRAKGHIPGARMHAHADLINDRTGTFLTREELLARVKETGISVEKDSISFCNTGHLASGSWFVLSELLGNSKAKLFDGSMHEWTKDSSRPVTKKWEMN